METGTSGIDEICRVRREKAKKLEEKGWPSYPNRIAVKHTAEDVIKAPVEANQSFCVAGRLLAIRGMGKSMFCDLVDHTGKIQIQLREDVLGQDDFERCKLLDLGDIVVVEGSSFLTRRGELTIEVKSIKLATKNMYPLPDKHGGLTDKEARYRQRYVDLIVNRDVREVFMKRSKMVRALRKFLDDRKFLEVETPMLHSVIGGAAAKPFVTHHNALDMQLYCRIAPELYLKRLIVGGFDRVYELGRNFRNEGLSIQHNPEFTMLEFYSAYDDYQSFMRLIECLIREVAIEVAGTDKLPYGAETDAEVIDVAADFRRISVRDGLELKLKHVQLDDHRALLAVAEKCGLAAGAHSTLGKLQMDLFEHFWEAELRQPTFVYDFPIEVSPLSRRRDDAPQLAERFELYIVGREVANAFSELNDAADQRSRFQAQMDARHLGEEETMDYDEDYCHALEVGMPPTAGAGIGVDRLAMLLTNAASIRDVILFPQMRKV